MVSNGRTRVTAAAGGAAALAVLTGCVLTRPAPGEAPAACRTVWVTSNGFHTGIAVPAATARAAGFEPGAAPWVEFGWGEDGAYRGERLTLGAATRAALGGEGVLHVAPLADRPDRLYAPGVATAVAVSEVGEGALAEDLRAEVVRDAEGRALVVGPGKGRGATFYAARTPYRTWRTCNVWTADRLRRAGVDVPRAGSTLAPVLTRRLRGGPTCGDGAVDNAAARAGAGVGTRGLVGQ